jgi:hypothetical protein
MLRRHPLAISLALWSILVGVVAIALAIGALATLDAANQRCFLDYPSAPCPGVDDPAMRSLELALFGMPVIWLAGVVVILVRVRVARSKPVP